MFGKPASKTGFDDLKRIDAVMAKEDTIALLVIHKRPWDGSDAEYRSVKAKIDMYLAYALDGQLFRDNPSHAGKSVEIHVDMPSGPPDRVVRMLRVLQQRLPEQLSIQLLVKTL